MRISSTAALSVAVLLRHPVTDVATNHPHPAQKFPSLLDASITELSSLLDNGVITSYELTQLYIQRINEVNSDLHAVIEINPDALTIASDLDRKRRKGRSKLSSLFGIPILIKDNYATNDSMLTGAGSVCLSPAPSTIEATTVTKLRNAGVVILGKTNLAEFSGARGSFVPEGWSSRGGQTFGAYVRHQSACGSSSGSGVAASLGLAAAALGTETAGSITCPARYNNVVGIKPTMGFTSRYGIVPVTVRQDTAGPIARTLEDAAIVLDAISGVDERDNYTLAQPWGSEASPPSFVDALNKGALRGKRMGFVWMEQNVIFRDYWPNKAETKAIFEASKLDFEAAGAEVVDVDITKSSVPMELLIQWVLGNSTAYSLPDMRDGLQGFIDTIPAGVGPVHDWKTLIECMKNDPREEGDKWNYDYLEKIAQIDTSAGSLSAWRAYENSVNITRGLVDELMAQHEVDALVFIADIALGIGAPAGLPIVTVPMGSLPEDAETMWDHTNTTLDSGPGMPLGLSLLGDRWTDVELVGYAYAYEQVSLKRKLLQPYIRPKSDLDSLVGRLNMEEEL